MHLSDIYQHQAQYCVMFLSQFYATKLWPTHKREHLKLGCLKNRKCTFFQFASILQKYQASLWFVR